MMCTYWEQHYTVCHDSIPLFLESIAGKILNTGKYLNVVRQCGMTAFLAVLKFNLLMCFVFKLDDFELETLLVCLCRTNTVDFLVKVPRVYHNSLWFDE